MTQQERSRKGGLKKYGISLDDLKRMYEAQGGCCAICEKKVPLFGSKTGEDKKGISIDHCHKTGTVRKLLCGRCNRALGYLDDEVWLSKATSYLLEFRASSATRGRFLVTKGQVTKHVRGSGSIFSQKNSAFLWIQYFKDGRRFRESTGSVDSAVAEAILRNRLMLSYAGALSLVPKVIRRRPRETSLTA